MQRRPGEDESSDARLDNRLPDDAPQAERSAKDVAPGSAHQPDAQQTVRRRQAARRAPVRRDVPQDAPDSAPAQPAQRDVHAPEQRPAQPGRRAPQGQPEQPRRQDSVHQAASSREAGQPPRTQAGTTRTAKPAHKAKATPAAKQFSRRRRADFSAVTKKLPHPDLSKLAGKIKPPDFSDVLRRILWPENYGGKNHKQSRISRHARSGRRSGGSGSQLWLIPVVILLLALFGLSLFRLGSYVTDYVRSKRISAELRDAYFSEENGPETLAGEPAAVMPPPEAEPAVTPEPTHTATPVVTSTPTPAKVADAPSTPDPLASMPVMRYPSNPGAVVRDRFRKLQRQNKDIIGWLTVGDLLSEAVVQRDNSFYLKRDYLGYHNVNGAIFLDEQANLSTRPYTLTLYGHNMKTGAMFGCLRNYEDIGYYHKSPFIQFDSLYEDGQYVIFAIAQVSIDVRSSKYSGFYRLDSCTPIERADIISGLCSLSMYTCPVDVDINDQLLLLVTCVGDESERRVVAARRFRDGETEGGLYALVHRSQSR